MKEIDKTDNYTHILKYTGVFGGVQGLSILVGIIRNKLVALILGPEGMGLASLFNSTIKLVSDSSNLGIGMSAVRNISDDFGSDDVNKLNRSICVIRSWSFITAILGFVLCLVMSPLLNKWTFGWGDHTLHFILLSPIIAFMAISSGELAILKGTRHLSQLAALSVYNVIGALITSVPIYYYFGESGIVPSLIVIALIQMSLVILISYRIFPLKLSFKREVLGEGVSMVKLGIAFVFAGIMGSGADFVIRSYLNHVGSLNVVGLYNAGFMLTMTYAGMVFSAMETDFFPRLSAVHDNVENQNQTVNQQIEVSLLLISPMLVFFIIFLPIILPLLYSGKFMAVLDMIQISALAMYMRAIKLPIAYLPLAKGDSTSYLLMEAIYDLAIVVLVCTMYHYYGLTGTGIAITVTSVMDFFMLMSFMHWKYKYAISSNVVKYILCQIPIGILAYVVTCINNRFIYWSSGMLLIIVSSLISIYILHRKTHLWKSLVQHFKRVKVHD